jgi:hypothetical protein
MRNATLLALGFLVACQNESPPDFSVERQTQIKFIQVPNRIDTIPKLDDLGFVEEPCLIWNRPEEFPRELIRIPRENGRRANREARRFEPNETTLVVDFDVTPESITPLLMAQLRVTATYFGSGDEADIKKMKAPLLFEVTEDPFFYEIVDKPTGRLYTVTNIAAGGNPMEIAFEHGSLQPVTVTEDGGLSFCADSILNPAQPAND